MSFCFVGRSVFDLIDLSAVFIATRDLQDEEVFFNYRYNPRLQPPEWYSPVDAKQEANRWR
jgi:hypothetical protein